MIEITLKLGKKKITLTKEELDEFREALRVEKSEYTPYYPTYPTYPQSPYWYSTHQYSTTGEAGTVIGGPKNE